MPCTGVAVMNSALEEAWCIVLAGGEGSRLAPLTRAMYGKPIPKQFAVLTKSGSLLQNTMARMASLVPASRTVVVVQEEYRALAAEQLAQYEGVTLVLQPRNLGTAIGILLGLVHVRRKAPKAQVVVVPADHHFERPQPLLTRLRRILAQGHRSINLVAVPAEGPETGFGWIVPSLPAGEDLREVWRFVEKPDPALAEHLFKTGAVWNTFLFTAGVEQLWDLLAHALPAQAEQLGAWAARGDKPLRAIYETLAPADFSSAILTNCPELRVTIVSGTGWADWGTPARVLESPAALPEVRAAAAKMCRNAADRTVSKADRSGEAA